MKARKQLSGNASNALHLHQTLLRLFQKSGPICGRNRLQSRPGKASGRMFMTMGIQFCRTWSFWFLTGVRPALSYRRSARFSAAGCLPLPVRDRRPPVCSLCSRSRSRFLHLKMCSRKFPSASRLRLSKRKKFVFAERLSLRQNRQPRHEPRAVVSSSGNRAVRRRCGGRRPDKWRCSGPGGRGLPSPKLTAGSLYFKAVP